MLFKIMALLAIMQLSWPFFMRQRGRPFWRTALAGGLQAGGVGSSMPASLLAEAAAVNSPPAAGGGRLRLTMMATRMSSCHRLPAAARGGGGQLAAGRLTTAGLSWGWLAISWGPTETGLTNWADNLRHDVASNVAWLFRFWNWFDMSTSCFNLKNLSRWKHKNITDLHFNILFAELLNTGVLQYLYIMILACKKIEICTWYFILYFKIALPKVPSSDKLTMCTIQAS